MATFATSSSNVIQQRHPAMSLRLAEAHGATTESDHAMSEKERNTDADDSVNLQAVYSEICESLRSVSDLRMKLLAFLPLASGTGLVAIANVDKISDVARPHLLAIGIFGSIVSFALYLCEIRGIHRCEILSAQARKLEREMVRGRVGGAFFDIPEASNAYISSTYAAAIIYSATISVWAYVAFCGAPERYPIEDVRIWVSLGLFVLVMIWGVEASEAELKACEEFDKEEADERAR